MSAEHWLNKTTFLDGVDGNEIVQEVDKINDADGMFVTHTQHYPTGDKKDGKLLFDSFIIYKVDPNAGLSINKQGVVEEQVKDEEELVL